MSAPPPVANSGEDVILRQIEVESETFADEGVKLEDAYEVEMTIKEILKGGYERIALQFPDELLHDAVPVFRAIRDRLPIEIELYVLADTTYGSCCVDEVAAQHVDADLIIHYGHTCLSPTARLPVIYVLTKRSIDCKDAANALASTSKVSMEDTKAVVLMYDVSYAHKAAEVHSALLDKLSVHVILSRVDRQVNLRNKGKDRQEPEAPLSTSTTPFDFPPPSSSSELETETETSNIDRTPADGISELQPAPTPVGLVPSMELPSKPIASGTSYELPEGLTIKDCTIFYLGGESLGLNNLLMTHGTCPVWSYNPLTKEARLESSKTNRMLMRRYAVVEKAKDADVIGILVGTLGVAAYLPLITHLRELIASHQKKSYTVAVGKLNPAKLANFMEVECFVLVACPENTLIDSKEFLRPIVTPFELELALTSKSWTGDYILDFTTLLSTSTFGQDFVDPNNTNTDEEGPVFSSVTGTYRHPKRYFANGVTDTDDLTAQASALALRNPASAVARVLGSAGGEFLSNRSYKGLEPRYGLDAPAVVEDGRSGIARGYGDERD